jgi:hypothetical protein
MLGGDRLHVSVSYLEPNKPPVDTFYTQVVVFLIRLSSLPSSTTPMASDFCIVPNTDISGIGVRTATYAQNILSFVPAFLALLDRRVSDGELDSLEGQSTTILLSAFALLIAAFIQAHNHGLDNYHTTIVLNLSWMNNTNTFIYILFLLHRKPWNKLLYNRRSAPNTGKTAESGGVVTESMDTSDGSSQAKLDTKPIARSLASRALAVIRAKSPMLKWMIDKVNPVVLIGSLHLSVTGALGILLWFNPGSFGASQSCSLTATTSLFGHAMSLSSQGCALSPSLCTSLFSFPA